MTEINTRKRGSKWEYRFEIASVDGKRKQKSKGEFRTKKGNLEAGTKALNEYNNCDQRYFAKSLPCRPPPVTELPIQTPFIFL